MCHYIKVKIDPSLCVCVCVCVSVSVLISFILASGQGVSSCLQ